jgi:hypothetical protein
MVGWIHPKLIYWSDSLYGLQSGLCNDEEFIMKTMIKYALLTISLNLSVVTGQLVQAAEPSPTNDWQHGVTLYLWLPSLDGEFKYQLEDGDSLPIDASQILDALNMAFMGAYEARKDKWSFIGDLIYLNLSNDKDRETIGYSNVNLKLKGWQVGLYGGYNLYQTSRSSLDMLAGLRYLTIETEAKLTSDLELLPDLNLTRNADVWDGIIGFRGRTNINENWFIPYHADVGAGDSDLTWQGMAGIGYQAGWGDTILVYRHLEWDQGEDKLMQSLSFTGPAIAVKFRF